jgi:hypothetical protein
VVQNKAFVYYFGGKLYKHLENKLSPPHPRKNLENLYKTNKKIKNIIKNIYFIYE